jgi:hypothetical protein
MQTSVRLMKKTFVSQLQNRSLACLRVLYETQAAGCCLYTSLLVVSYLSSNIGYFCKYVSLESMPLCFLYLQVAPRTVVSETCYRP